eukprot:2754053-Ditylum_brightwellii.AAC.1
MPALTRAAMKAGKSKDAVTKDNKTAPSLGKCKSDNQGVNIGRGNKGNPVLEQRTNKKSLRSLILTATGATLEAAKTKGRDDTDYKNGDSMKKRKVLLSTKDMEVDKSRIKDSTCDNQPTNKKQTTPSLISLKTNLLGMKSDDDEVEDAKEASYLFKDAGKVAARAFFEKN